MKNFPKIDPDLKKELESLLTSENSLCSSFLDPGNIQLFSESNRHVFYLTVTQFVSNSPPQREPNKCSLYPRFLGFLTLNEVCDDDLARFPLYLHAEVLDVSFKSQGAVILSSTEYRNLCWYHFSVLESMLFQGHIFETVSATEHRDVLASLLEEMPNFMKPTCKRSWYLIVPVIEDLVQEQYDTGSRKPCSELIDSSYACDVVANIRNFSRPGVPLSYLEHPSTTILSIYNNSKYKVHYPIKHANFKDTFPKRGRGDSTTLPQYETFEQYYIGGLKLEHLDLTQKLVCVHNITQTSAVKQARRFLQPVSISSNINLFGSQKMFVVPSLHCLHPLHALTICASCCTFATCWKFESILKVAELRNSFIYKSARQLSPMCPPVGSLSEALTLGALSENENYERLEFLGDSILKLIVTLHFSLSDGDPSNGDGLELLRHDLLSNATLAKQCISSGLKEYIRLGRLGSHSWVPPGFEFLDKFIAKHGVIPKRMDEWDYKSKQQYRYKVLADVIEAVVGAFFLHGGFVASLFSIDVLGIAPVQYMLTSVDEQESRGSDRWLMSLFQWLPTTYDQFVMEDKNSADKMKGIEKILNYSFTNKTLLQTVMKQRDTTGSSCFLDKRQLAFIGDSLLDVLIIQHSWDNCSEMDAGKLTAMKQHINNHERLCQLAASLGLHKYTDYETEEMNEAVRLYIEQIDNFADVSVFGEGKYSAPAQLFAFMQGLVGATYFDSYGSISLLFKIWIPLLEPIMCYTPVDKTQPVAAVTTYCAKKRLKLEWRKRLPPENECNGDQDKDMCTIDVVINGEVIATGIADSEKTARREAAASAFCTISFKNNPY